MLYVCIPVHNEAATIGVLLWRIRTVFQEQSRDYEVVVYDDGSTDATADVVEPYTKVLPLTVLRGDRRQGTAAATEALVRHVVAHTRYPRRDAVVLMQGDFTDRPEDLLEFARRFDGGADLVAGTRGIEAGQPPAEQRLRRLAPWALRPFVRVAGLSDLLPAMRLYRVSVLRDLVRARGAAPLGTAAGWAGSVELLLASVPHARRVETLPVGGTYDVRERASRLSWGPELRALAGLAWRSRGRAVAPGAPAERRERPERTDASERAEAPDRAPRASRTPGEERASRAGGTAREGATPVESARAERPRRREKARRGGAAPAEGPAATAPVTRTPPAPAATAAAEPEATGAGADEGTTGARKRSRRRRRGRGGLAEGGEVTSVVGGEEVDDASEAATEPVTGNAEPRTLVPEEGGTSSTDGDDADAAPEARARRARRRRRSRRTRADGAPGDTADADDGRDDDPAPRPPASDPSEVV